MALPYVTAFAFSPPAILGLGTTGGFDFRLEAREDQTPQELAAAAWALVMAANQNPRLTRVFTTFRADTPQVYVNLDRTKAEYLGVPTSRVFATLQAYLGSMYVNDFNLFQRTYQVKVQAQAPYRNDLADISHIYVRNSQGRMVLLSSMASISTVLGPKVVHRYNQFPSVQINGQAVPGYSSGEAMAAMEGIASKVLPKGFGFEWSSSSFQQRKSRGQVQVLFFLAMMFAYLFLVGQYESWILPLPIILYIPVAAMGALLGLWVVGLSFSIFAQIGLVMLVGLASKNAILIVEFSRDKRREGLSIEEAALEGAKARFRPVLMTAFTFILGVAPLVIATGAGAMSRRHIGTVVFSGMLVATTLGILLIPGLYYLLQSVGEKRRPDFSKARKRNGDENS
jgi:multidrug efflux pump subunit AcrB